MSPDFFKIVGTLGLAYIIGALPFGFWLVKHLKGIDLRTVGSGGTGATNVKRTAGKQLAALTLFLDVVKGALAVYIAQQFAPTSLQTLLPLAAGSLAILGHSRSIFIQFKGGKSVAVSLGVFLMLEPVIMSLAILAGVLIITLTRFVSLGSMLGAIIAFILSFIFPHVFWMHQVLFGLVAAYIIWLHRENIQRLCKGCENKL